MCDGDSICYQAQRQVRLIALRGAEESAASTQQQLKTRRRGFGVHGPPSLPLPTTPHRPRALVPSTASVARRAQGTVLVPPNPPTSNRGQGFGTEAAGNPSLPRISLRLLFR
jgi:hypothetical protein